MSIDHIPDDFGHWFAGFVDGEGHFKATAQGHQSNKRRIHLHLALRIALRADDMRLIDKIHATLQVGKVYHTPKYSCGRVGSKPQSVWAVHRYADLMGVIIPLFDKYPLKSKKKRDYIQWKHIVQTWGPPRPRRGDGLKFSTKELLAAIGDCNKLKDVRAYDYDPILAAEIEAQQVKIPEWQQGTLI